MSDPSLKPSSHTSGALDEWAEQYRALQASIAEMTRSAAALRELIEQTERVHGIEPGAPGSRLEGVAATRVDRILDIVSAADGPVSLKEIGTQLDQMGHAESSKDVASAVSYLRSKGAVERVGRGMWKSTG